MPLASVQINKQAGFSLTSILVVLGVTALLFIGINQISQNQQDAQNHIVDSMTTKEIRNHIEENIDCLATGISALACDDPEKLIKLVSRNGLVLVNDDSSKYTVIDKWKVKASCDESVLVYVQPWRKKAPLKQTPQQDTWQLLISDKDKLCHKKNAPQELTRVASLPLKPISNFVPYDECGSQRWNEGWTSCRNKDFKKIDPSCFDTINRDFPNKKMMITARIWERTVKCNDDEVAIGGGANCAPNFLIENGKGGCFYDPATMPGGPPEACRRGGGVTMFSGPYGNGWRTRCCTATYAAQGENKASDVAANYSNSPLAQAFCRKIGGNGDVK